MCDSRAIRCLLQRFVAVAGAKALEIDAIQTSPLTAFIILKGGTREKLPPRTVMRNKRLFILSRGRGVLLEFYPGWRKERQCSSHEGSPRTLAALLSGTSRILPWRARLNCQAPQNRERMGCRTGPTERDDAKAAWNHASLPFGGSSTWVLNVVGEIVPSLIRLGTIVSYHFKIQTIVDGHCVVM